MILLNYTAAIIHAFRMAHLVREHFPMLNLNSAKREEQLSQPEQRERRQLGVGGLPQFTTHSQLEEDLRKTLLFQ